MTKENKTKRNSNDGVSIASIVAKGTAEGKWSGTGGGVGFGTGGLGFFVGGMSGSETRQSLLASELEAPRGIRPRSMTSLLAPLGFLGMAIWFSVAPDMLMEMAGGNGLNLSTDIPLGNIDPEVMQNLIKTAPLVLVTLSAISFIMSAISKKKEREQEQENEKAAKRSEVYYRLRYVESDHVVFDPKTGMELSATRENVARIVYAAAEQ